jgi:endonuclease/exonuclease/phosphatase (EEP) superfamily protein YafD
LAPLITPAIPETANTLVWLIDLASHWQWLFLGGFILFGTIAALLEKRLAVLLLAAPLPWFTALEPAPATNGDIQSLKVATANVGLDNKDPQALLDWLDAEGIELAVLSEVTPAYAHALQAGSSFEYRHLVPRSGPFGLALMSRHRLIAAQDSQDGDGIPRIQATVLWQEQPGTVTALHPMPPISTRYHHARNVGLRTAAQEAVASGQPSLLMGDLNASPWSSGMLGPSNAGYRRATGLSPTWPAELRGLLGIPIDQILVSEHWAVEAAGTGPVLDSDHIPVWARLGLLQGTVRN